MSASCPHSGPWAHISLGSCCFENPVALAGLELLLLEPRLISDLKPSTHRCLSSVEIYSHVSSHLAEQRSVMSWSNSFHFSNTYFYFKGICKQSGKEILYTGWDSWPWGTRSFTFSVDCLGTITGDYYLIEFDTFSLLFSLFYNIWRLWQGMCFSVSVWNTYIKAGGICSSGLEQLSCCVRSWAQSPNWGR